MSKFNNIFAVVLYDHWGRKTHININDSVAALLKKTI